MEKLIYQKKFNELYPSVSIFRIVIRYVICILLFVIALCAILGYRVYFVGGWSMQPTIDYMDLIIVDQGVNKYTLEEGDIVTFDYGLINTHRIIKVNRDSQRHVISYTTKGDNPNITMEETFAPEKVVGKIVTLFGEPITMSHLGYVVEDIQDNKVLIFIYIFAMYMFFTFGQNPRKYVDYDASIKRE